MELLGAHLGFRIAWVEATYSFGMKWLGESVGYGMKWIEACIRFRMEWEMTRFLGWLDCIGQKCGGTGWLSSILISVPWFTDYKTSKEVVGSSGLSMNDIREMGAGYPFKGKCIWIGMNKVPYSPTAGCQYLKHILYIQWLLKRSSHDCLLWSLCENLYQICRT